MSAPAKMPTTRQLHQAAVLSVLAALVIADERVSEILEHGLDHISHHLSGEHRQDDLRHFTEAARKAGAAITEWPPAGADDLYDSVMARWSEHFAVRLQCHASDAVQAAAAGLAALP